MIGVVEGMVRLMKGVIDMIGERDGFDRIDMLQVAHMVKWLWTKIGVYRLISGCISKKT